MSDSRPTLFSDKEFTVVRYDKDVHCHILEDDDGNEFRVDIEIDRKGFAESLSREALIGRKVKVGWLQPFIYIARDVTTRRTDEESSAFEGGAA